MKLKIILILTLKIKVPIKNSVFTINLFVQKIIGLSY